jgi:hypothetical protein
MMRILSSRTRLLLAALVPGAWLIAMAAVAPAKPLQRYPRAHASIINGTLATGPGPLALVTNGVGQCSGTVISNNVVMTAAHCVYDLSTRQLLDPSKFIVQTSAVSTRAPTGTYSRVNRIIPHTWQPSNFYGDLALLQLATTVTAPAMPLATNADLGLLNPGTVAIAEGWGVVVPGSDQPSTDLRLGSFAVQSPSYCSNQAQQFGVLFDSSGTLCAIDPSFQVSTCSGDSGGPLVALRSDRTIAQIGITSYGSAGCPTSRAGFFTRVDAFSSWITSWVTALAPPPPAAPMPVSPPIPTPPPTPTTPTSPVAPAPVAQAPIARPARFEGYTAHSGFVSTSVSTDGRHLSWIRISMQLRCRSGYRTYINDVFNAPSAMSWPMSSTEPLRVTMTRKSNRHFFAQTDTLTLAPGHGGLLGTVKVSVRARALKIGRCTASASLRLAARNERSVTEPRPFASLTSGNTGVLAEAG